MATGRTVFGVIVTIVIAILSRHRAPPQVGPSFLGVKKERPAIAQPQQGLEHGALSQKSQTFTPVPIVPTG